MKFLRAATTIQSLGWVGCEHCLIVLLYKTVKNNKKDIYTKFMEYHNWSIPFWLVLIPSKRINAIIITGLSLLKICHL